MLRYWIWLATRKGVGARSMREILNYFGTPELAYRADRTEYSFVPELNERQLPSLLDKDLTEAERILTDCENKRIRILTYQDAAYPERLKNISDPPMVLYYQGSLPDVDHTPAIGVVGTRSASAYGLLQAKKFGYQLGKSGAIVISGMARGIDTLGMEGALSAGGTVIGVLGCGVDRIYPAENRSLYRDAAAHGCILSEYPPGTPPDAKNFPVRNRIISGLSVGVLVVEASRKSGALITASLALEQGRDVFAIPSNLDSDAGIGTNQLIRSGAALVTCAWDILGEYTMLFPDKLLHAEGGENLTLLPRDLEREKETAPAKPVKPARAPQENTKKSVDNPEKRTYIDLNEVRSSLPPHELALAEQLSEQPVHVDELIEKSGLTASEALSALTLLELRHIAVRLPGRRYRLAEKGPN